MTAPTHLIFAAVCAVTGEASYSSAAACALGALLPDLDHHKSSIGRVLFFVSHPLYMRFGHRGVIHSFFLYAPVLIAGIMFHHSGLKWLAVGALSHILLDCYNTNGVKAFAPFSHKSVVLFKRDWRVNAGSLGEIYVFVLLAAMLPAVHYSQSIGGARKLINLIIRSPQITEEEFRRAGNARCFARGEFRWNDGRIETVEWLVVGTEGGNLVYWNGQRLVRFRNGAFARSSLIISDKSWPLVKVNGIILVAVDSVYMIDSKWHLARAGQKAAGIIKTLSGDMPEVKLCDPSSQVLPSLLFWQFPQPTPHTSGWKKNIKSNGVLQTRVKSKCAYQITRAAIA